ncbi:protein-(glutamine-N5) methyltransferase, release factor-specific [Treponema vincentii F0403]|uniref:Protein-(Glutamine-N5) methyltransferase, release factor-specific n=1 Tax=Treponema vincentii F0403 TaxID=1125702 RepID=S3LCA6_9SPIR|nr:peptide chain release factor N(5)-glutamine methyltransferase [Treponema vincentii]EPF48058.1 protein-(glutamine-N5) methyltransferase, release factor-specific [Treponema vincentii F0403]
MFTVADARRYAVQLFARSARLKTQARSSLMLDADVLLQHFLNKPRAWLFAHDDADISPIRETFCEAVERRSTGLPIAYITGEKDFWGLSFKVSPDVLIPKPDTELLVERSLAVIKEKAEALRPPEQTLYLLDPCTGSGCVAISILYTLEVEGIRNIVCVAVDISPAALAIARLNAERLLSAEAQRRLCFIEGDMRSLPETIARVRESLSPSSLLPNILRFDLIAANPPYVPSALTQELLKDGRNEPALALDGGSDGLDFIRILTNNIRTVLNGGGVLLSEVGEYHAHAARRLFENAGFSNVRIRQDLAGQDRLIEGVSG